MWNQAHDDLSEIEREHGAEFTAEHRLQVVQVKALLAIAQALSERGRDDGKPE